MALDPYSPCPCGSGKKFKWCCQPIHVQIDKAFQQEAEGQHEAALRIMDEVVTEHSGNPEAWGRKAYLLSANGKQDEAEQALQHALDINPDYPFGHLLRGLFRQNEGESAGALLLFRKAAELYDPAAHGPLAQAYSLIFECEQKHNHPVAARAALKLCMRYDPASTEVREAFERLFGDESPLPASARRELTFQSPQASAPATRRAAWDRALNGAATGKLAHAVQAFELLTHEDSTDAPAWYNLAVARAWLGMNRAALDALERYVELESDVDRAASAWCLGEVLRLGRGMDNDCDYIEHSVAYQIREPRPVVELLNEYQQNRRLLILQTRQEDNFLMGLYLDRETGLAQDSALAQSPRLASFFMVLGDLLRMWHTNQEVLNRAREDVEKRAGAGLSAPHVGQSTANFSDVLAELLFVSPTAKGEESEQRLREQVQRYFEDTWPHRPRRSLSGMPPLDGAGHPTLRKKLFGVIQFVEECAAQGGQPYDFNRLRSKLGLIASPGATEAGVASVDIDVLGVAELSALDAEGLTDDRLEQAFQAAVKLDARDLAGRFAQAIVNRPPRPDRPDRYPCFMHLVQLALSEGDPESALDYLNEGEKHDCEHNDGRRRNDYELRRAQIHARRGETDAAQELFDRLIERAPAELRYRSTAVEAMLSARQGGPALRLAEQGLAKAREQNNRDSEQHFLELVAAARKQTG